MFEKLVRKKRGGYCFELNGLFQMALEATGFDVRPLLCRVHRNEIPSCRVHQISLVNIDGGQWIADAGSGSGTLAAPILLELDQPIIFKDRTVRLIEDAHLGFIVQYLEEEDWSDIYSFDLGYVLPVDIECANHFTSTHPSHFFTFSRVAALPLENGRISLHNHTLKRITSGKEDIQELSEGQEYLDALKNHFGIELDASYEDLRPLPGTE
jgi:N-hydroxyarylamine O-acetyltransferase